MLSQWCYMKIYNEKKITNRKDEIFWRKGAPIKKSFGYAFIRGTDLGVAEIHLDPILEKKKKMGLIRKMKIFAQTSANS